MVYLYIENMKYLKFFENKLNNIPIDDISGYLNKMGYGLEDKLYFLNMIDIDCLVDFGAADGVILEKIKKIKPNITTIGYDIDDMMISQMNKKNIDYVTNDISKVKRIIKEYKNPGILLSSVLHEVYSYSTNKEIIKFWEFLFNSDFKYIIIRDMSSQKSYKNFNISDSEIDNVYKLSKLKLIKDFESKWGFIKKDYHTLLHYLMKYKYETNWNREVIENYLPITLEDLKNKIPSNWLILYENSYILPFFKNMIKKDFNIEITKPTHLKMILKNKNLF
jgi:hypothetical protein